MQSETKNSSFPPMTSQINQNPNGPPGHQYTEYSEQSDMQRADLYHDERAFIEEVEALTRYVLHITDNVMLFFDFLNKTNPFWFGMFLLGGRTKKLTQKQLISHFFGFGNLRLDRLAEA